MDDVLLAGWAITNADEPPPVQGRRSYPETSYCGDRRVLGEAVASGAMSARPAPNRKPGSMTSAVPVARAAR